MKQPWISAMHIALYPFLLSFFFFWNQNSKDSLKAFPLKKWFLFVFVTFLLSGLFGEEGYGTGAYSASRFFIDSYGALLAAFIIGLKCDYKQLANIMFWPIIIFAILGLSEAVFKYNYIYSWMIDTFPLYDGYLEKTGVMNFFDSWRIRISITTLHPTTLGALLTALFIFYYHLWNSPEKKMRFILILLVALIFLSGSRSAWICSALYVIYSYVKNHAAIARFLFTILCIACIYHAGSSIVESFTSEDRGSSVAMRQRNLIICIASVMEKPITGHGFNYMHNLIVRQDNGYAEDGAMESIFFNLLVEQGFLGVFAHFGFVIASIMAFKKRKNENKMLVSAGSGIVAIITLFSLMSGTLGNLHTMAYILQGACLGILYAPKKEEPVLLEKK